VFTNVEDVHFQFDQKRPFKIFVKANLNFQVFTVIRGLIWNVVRRFCLTVILHCNAIAMLLHCYCNVIAMLLQCYCNAIALLLQCYCTVIAMLFQCYCNAIAMLLQCYCNVSRRGGLPHCHIAFSSDDNSAPLHKSDNLPQQFKTQNKFSRQPTESAKLKLQNQIFESRRQSKFQEGQI